MGELANPFSHLHFERIHNSDGIVGHGNNFVKNTIYFTSTPHNFLGPPCDVIRKDCEKAMAWFPKDSEEYLTLRNHLYTMVQFAKECSRDAESPMLPLLHDSGHLLHQSFSPPNSFVLEQTEFLEAQAPRFLEKVKESIHANWDMTSRIFLRISLAQNKTQNRTLWSWMAWISPETYNRIQKGRSDTLFREVERLVNVMLYLHRLLQQQYIAHSILSNVLSKTIYNSSFKFRLLIDHFGEILAIPVHVCRSAEDIAKYVWEIRSIPSHDSDAGKWISPSTNNK